MGNQFNSKKTECEKKYNMPIKDILLMMSSRGMTYMQVAKDLNYAVATIRGYCVRYNITLKPSCNEEQNIKRDMSALKQIRSTELNKIKVMSMRW